VLGFNFLGEGEGGVVDLYGLKLYREFLKNVAIPTEMGKKRTEKRSENGCTKYVWI
jgi:hypothetical protein